MPRGRRAARRMAGQTVSPRVASQPQLPGMEFNNFRGRRTGSGNRATDARRREIALRNQQRRRNAAAGRTARQPAPRRMARQTALNLNSQPSLFDPGPANYGPHRSQLGAPAPRVNKSAQQMALNLESGKSVGRPISRGVTKMGRVGLAAGAIGAGAYALNNRRRGSQNQSLYR